MRIYLDNRAFLIKDMTADDVRLLLSMIEEAGYDERMAFKDLKKQIAQIENKISGDRQAIASIEQEISAAKVDIFVKQQDLKASADHIKNQMLADKKMLTDVLPND